MMNVDGYLGGRCFARGRGRGRGAQYVDLRDGGERIRRRGDVTCIYAICTCTYADRLLNVHDHASSLQREREREKDMNVPG